MSSTRIPTSRRSSFTSALSLTALVAALGAMAVLHVVQPNLDPFREPVSFYVHGNRGWLLPVALGFFSVAAIALAAPAANLAPANRRLLRIFGIGMIVTAVVPSDRWFPWEATPTVSGLVHATAAVIAPVLLLVVMWTVVRTSGRSARIEAAIAAAYVLGIAGSALSLVVGFLLDAAPPFIGLAERVLAISAVAWIATVAVRPRTAETSARL